jgi:UV DNA damage endonuclease
MAYRLGFAVKVLGNGGLPSHDTRRWQSGPHLRVSLERLGSVFDYLEEVDVRMYRLASGLVPYGSHPELPQFHDQVGECTAELAALGERARVADLRLSFHPGQYVVLNSENPEVRRAAARDLELQAAVLNAMGLDEEAVVVLHVGGGAGGTEAALDRFRAGFEQLGERARARLVLENDDRRFGLADVLALSERSGEERGRRVERRLVLPPLRAHADLIDPVSFETFLSGPAAGLELDVMLEAKAKDLALIRLREQLAERGFGWEEGRLHATEPG